MKKLLLLLLALPHVLVAQDVVRPRGYSDTPLLPGSKWKVHDIDRPAPKPVDPGKTSADPPADAVVLFDGSDLSAWYGETEKPNPNPKKKRPIRTADPEEPAKWKVVDGYMEVTPTGNIYTKEKFGDCQLHIEWRAPTPVADDSQHRGNSGIWLLNRYEIQVLDAYENPTYADGHPGAVYGQAPPLVNAARKPGEWQTYDIIFKAPRFAEDGSLKSPGYVTVIHNGIVVQHHTELLGPIRHKKVASYDTPHPEKDVIRLQDHNDNQKVAYRNIWVRHL